MKYQTLTASWIGQESSRNNILFDENLGKKSRQREVFPDIRALTVAAAERFAVLATRAVEDHCPEKAPLLAEVLQVGADVRKYPVQQVRPRNGIKRWMLDASAAARI